MIQAIPKPVNTKKARKSLQRRKPLQAKSFLHSKPAKEGTKHKTRKHTGGETRIPESVMKIVRTRSKGFDELDHGPGANQGHHIKHRSTGGLDLAINILHLSERNHPHFVHETLEGAKAAEEILYTRIINTFPEARYYSVEEIATRLNCKESLIERQITKGFLKARINLDLRSLDIYEAHQEDIIRWLRA